MKANLFWLVLLLVCAGLAAHLQQPEPPLCTLAPQWPTP